MAATSAINNQLRGVTVGTLNLGTYATGGVAVAGGLVGCPTRLVYLRVDAAGGYVFEWDSANQKVKAYWTGAGLSGVLAEVTNATNLAAVNPNFTAMGS